jgi:hypothetical protein
LEIVSIVRQELIVLIVEDQQTDRLELLDTSALQNQLRLNQLQVNELRASNALLDQQQKLHVLLELTKIKQNNQIVSHVLQDFSEHLELQVMHRILVQQDIIVLQELLQEQQIHVQQELITQILENSLLMIVKHASQDIIVPLQD